MASRNHTSYPSKYLTMCIIKTRQRKEVCRGVSICGCNWWPVEIPPVRGRPWKLRPLNELCTADLHLKSLLQLHRCWERLLALISSEGWRLQSRLTAGGNLNHHPGMKFYLSCLVMEHQPSPLSRIFASTPPPNYSDPSYTATPYKSGKSYSVCSFGGKLLKI